MPKRGLAKSKDWSTGFWCFLKARWHGMEFLSRSWHSMVARQMKRAFSGAFGVNWCGVMGFNIDWCQGWKVSQAGNSAKWMNDWRLLHGHTRMKG
jgi:hypothetical protein